MPTIRATVTIAEADPNDARPTASTAAVERGVTCWHLSLTHTDTAAHAIAVASRQVCHLIITDYNMPLLDARDAPDGRPGPGQLASAQSGHSGDSDRDGDLGDGSARYRP